MSEWIKILREYFIVALVCLAAGLYGGWQLTKDRFEMVSRDYERVKASLEGATTALEKQAQEKEALQKRLGAALASETSASKEIAGLKGQLDAARAREEQLAAEAAALRQTSDRVTRENIALKRAAASRPAEPRKPLALHEDARKIFEHLYRNGTKSIFHLRDELKMADGNVRYHLSLLASQGLLEGDNLWWRLSEAGLKFAKDNGL